MKLLLITGLVLLTWTACQRSQTNTARLQTQIDSLKQAVSQAYIPGFGEFMSDIQVHHEKLWFAGKARNWKLANFEIHEIMESLDDIQKYETDRPERKELPMIYAPLDSVNVAIQEQNFSRFKASFYQLTNTCNACHRATQHGFNVIKIPDTPPFTDQVFSAKKNK